jgi:hypothetical protein
MKICTAFCFSVFDRQGAVWYGERECGTVRLGAWLSWLPRGGDNSGLQTRDLLVSFDLKTLFASLPHMALGLFTRLRIRFTARGYPDFAKRKKSALGMSM